MTWLTDANSNRASTEYFGSTEAAQAALDSLKDCKNCTNCSRCSYCSDCSRCSYCSDCSRCSGCSRCSYCSDCSRCSYCSDCSGCSGCSRCSYCSDCSRCSDCSGCSGCSGCSRCSYCSDCSRCSDCSGCSGCSRCSGVKGKRRDAAGEPYVRPPTPIIENIHHTVYVAASAPKALDMGHWHCGTTHCRAGWVVTLAGDAGKALEAATSTLHAAMLIYKASDPTWRMSNFFDNNESALEDMKRLAEQGKANHEVTP